MRALLPAILLAAACGGAQRSARDLPRDAEVVQMEEMRIRATGSGEDLHLESYDAEELFHEGFRRQNQADCAAAVQFYDRLASEFASSRFLSSALYDAGLCYEALDRFADAQARYDRLIRDLPESPDVKDALFRSGGCAEHLENAAKAEATFTTLLGREDLTPDEHLEAMTRHAAALLALERLDECEAEARRAIAFYRRAEGTQPIETDYFVAQAQYLLGEVLRVEFERIRFTADEAEMRRDLERKSRLLLDAQAEYILAIRTTNPHWAAASGYRIGEIFRNFYDHIMAAPVPASLDAEQREIYFEELRNQIRPLVQKAIRVWERTILMSERTGVHNEWVERTNADLESVRRMLVDGGSAPSPATEHAPPPAQPPAPARQQDPGPVG